jgi:isoquinoline 1-oxidoreductase alpha subunit
MARLTVNGKSHDVEVDPDTPLLWVLREHLGMTGTKYGCGVAACGACTVHIDGEAVRSCSMPVSAVAGKKITTIEGLADGDKLKPIQQAFLDHLGFQCGYCTSGMIMNAQGLLNDNPKPTRQQILDGMERNFCRCSAHQRIVDAVEQASHAPAVGASRGDV